MTSPYKNPQGLGRILAAFRYSCAGLSTAWRGEAAFRLLVWLNVVLLPLACMLDVSRLERLLLLLSTLATLLVELFNSAIEAAVDHTSLAPHPLAKQAKDLGSAAQMLALLMLCLVWGMVLWR